MIICRLWSPECNRELYWFVLLIQISSASVRSWLVNSGQIYTVCFNLLKHLSFTYFYKLILRKKERNKERNIIAGLKDSWLNHQTRTLIRCGWHWHLADTVINDQGNSPSSQALIIYRNRGSEWKRDRRGWPESLIVGDCHISWILMIGLFSDGVKKLRSWIGCESNCNTHRVLWKHPPTAWSNLRRHVLEWDALALRLALLPQRNEGEIKIRK